MSCVAKLLFRHNAVSGWVIIQQQRTGVVPEVDGTEQKEKFTEGKGLIAGLWNRPDGNDLLPMIGKNSAREKRAPSLREKFMT
jgi:hypothetical protein